MSAPDPAMADNLTALVAELRELLAVRPTDEWSVTASIYEGFAACIEVDGMISLGNIAHVRHFAHAQLIVAAVNALPALLDALEASQPKEDAGGGGVCEGCGGNGWSGGKQPLDKDGQPIGDLCDACEECYGDGKARTPAVGGIPAGMVAWSGGPKPSDWDGGPVMVRDGSMERVMLSKDQWGHSDKVNPRCHILAYTHKARPSDGEAREREAWPGRNADLMRRRVVTLATLGLMLSKTKDSLAYEIEGFEPESLYAEVLMALAVEDADDTDIALEIARDHPEGDTLADAILAALPTTDGAGGERGAIVSWLRHQSDLGANRGIAADKGTTKRAAFGGGSLALKRAADAIEAGEHRTNANNDATPPTTDASERMREALEAFEAIKELCDADETLLAWKTANDAIAALAPSNPEVSDDK